jgi:hypothetical protein
METLLKKQGYEIKQRIGGQDIVFMKKSWWQIINLHQYLFN